MRMKQLRQPVLSVTLLLLGLMAAPVSAESKVGWHLLGKFVLVSGQMRVSDPWTEKAPQKSALDLFRTLSVKNGQWQAAARFSDEGVNGIRVAELVALHVSTQAKSLTWSPEKMSIGVDSGMAGFFDDKYFRDETQVPPGSTPRVSGKPKPGDAWSSHFTEELISDLSAKLVPFGVMSRTGEGDGFYDLHVARGADGTIHGVRLTYLEAEDSKKLRKALQILFGQMKSGQAKEE